MTRDIADYRCRYGRLSGEADCEFPAMLCEHHGGHDACAVETMQQAQAAYERGFKEASEVAERNPFLCRHGWKGSNAERISTPCPACRFGSLFVGEGGRLTCSNLQCTVPALEAYHESMKRMNSAFRRALEAVLIFHQVGDWKELSAQWEWLTGTKEATTKALCDAVRAAIAEYERLV